jgi:hypothetical protein
VYYITEPDYYICILLYVSLLSGTVPSTPVNLKVTSAKITCNSILLSWESPRSNGGSSIEGYNITVMNDHERYDLQTMNTTITVTSLNPGTPYIISISAKNSVGLGLPADINATTEEIRKQVELHTFISACSIVCWVCSLYENLQGDILFNCSF